MHVSSGDRSKSIPSECDGSLDRPFKVDPLSYISYQPVLHDWCIKGRGMCSPVCGMEHIKEHLQLSEIIAHVVAVAALLSYHNGTLPYARRHITVLKCVESVVK